MNLTVGNTATLANTTARVNFASCRLADDLIAYGSYYSNRPRPSVAKINPDQSMTVYNGADVQGYGECIDVCALSETKFALLYLAGPSGYLYVRVATFSGSAVSVGSAYAVGLSIAGSLSPALAGGAIAALDSSTIVVAGCGNSVVIGRVIIGIVSGTSVSFGASVQFATTTHVIPSVAAVSATSYAVLYRDDRTGTVLRIVVGTRSGSVATIANDAGTAVTTSAYNALASVCMVSSTLAVISYYDTTLKKAARCARISGTTVTLCSAVAIDSGETSFQEAAGLTIMRPIDDRLFPRRVVALYRKTVSGTTGSYARIGNISSSGTISFTDPATYVYEAQAREVLPVCLTDWSLVALWIYEQVGTGADTLYANDVDITPLALSLTISPSDSLAQADAKQISVTTLCLEAVSAADALTVLPNYHFFEELGLDEAVARALSITRSQALALVQGLFLDGMYIGVGNGYWRVLSEELSLSAQEVAAVVKETLAEHYDLFDRLRVGGVWDEPTSRIVTSILRAAMSAERL